MDRRSAFSVVLSIILMATVILSGCDNNGGSDGVLIVEDEVVSRQEYEYQLVSLMKAYEYYSGEPIDWSKPIEGMPPEEFFASRQPTA